MLIREKAYHAWDIANKRKEEAKLIEYGYMDKINQAYEFDLWGNAFWLASEPTY